MGIVDVDALGLLVDRLARSGLPSIGLFGSTGLYAYLDPRQRQRAAVEALAERVPLIVGVGALRTDMAQALARDAEAVGADGMLIAPVSYTPLTQEEAYRHYEAVTRASGLPLCVYNNPGTTHFVFGRDLLDRLSGLTGIAALKMPLPTGETIAEELAALRARPARQLAIGYSGDAGMIDALLAGADGFHSVLAGFLPETAIAMESAVEAQDGPELTRLDQKLQLLWRLFRDHGSLRVAHAAAVLRGVVCELPPPLLPILDTALAELETLIWACLFAGSVMRAIG